MKRRTGRAGFSMIEALVATALLTIIVMMIGMLFQQTSIAWRAGSKRAEGFMQIRSIIGAIQRDASRAVDAEGVKEMRRRMGGEKDTAAPGPDTEQSFSGSSLIFYTLSGDEENRALRKITYDTGGKRTEKVVDKLDNPWSTGKEPDGKSRNVMATLKVGKDANKPTVVISDFEPEYGYGDKKGLPIYVTVRAKVVSYGDTVDIGAASAGPDKTFGTKDDITTWRVK